MAKILNDNLTQSSNNNNNNNYNNNKFQNLHYSRNGTHLLKLEEARIYVHVYNIKLFELTKGEPFMYYHNYCM